MTVEKSLKTGPPHPRARRAGAAEGNFRKLGLKLAATRTRVTGALRVAGFVGLASGVSLLVRLESARAAIDSALKDVVMASEGTLGTRLGGGPGHVFVMNGVRVRVQSTHDQQTITEVRSSFERECPSATFWQGSVLGHGHSTKDGDFTGACIWTKPGVPSRSALDIVTSLAKGADGGAAASASVLFARSVSDALESESRVVRLEVPLSAISGAFPPSGDAPGRDPSFIPRPMGRRLLSVQLEQESPSGRSTPPRELAYVYESEEAPSVALGRLVEQARQTHPESKLIRRADLALTYRDEVGYFSVVAAHHDKKTVLSLVRL
jgi:hypothetical protein